MGDKVQIVKLNIDENPETARAYRVMSVPTLTIFKGGEPVQSVLGAKPKGKIVAMIEQRSVTTPTRWGVQCAPIWRAYPDMQS